MINRDRNVVKALSASEPICIRQSKRKRDAAIGRFPDDTLIEVLERQSGAWIDHVCICVFFLAPSCQHDDRSRKWILRDGQLYVRIQAQVPVTGSGDECPSVRWHRIERIVGVGDTAPGRVGIGLRARHRSKDAADQVVWVVGG